MGAIFPPAYEDAGENGLVVFELDQQRYALRLEAVERVIPMVEIASLPDSPRAILGLLNMEGDVLPVYDLRHRFGLPPHEADPGDQLILAHTRKRRVALAVDGVVDVTTHPESATVEAGSILPDLKYVTGVIKRPDGLIFIHDLESFLSAEEEDALDVALTRL